MISERHVFSANNNKIFHFAIVLWIIAIISILFVVFLLIIISIINPWQIIAIILFIGFFTVPGLTIHFNYLKYSKFRELIIMEDSIELRLRGISIAKINGRVIDSLEYHSIDEKGHRSYPWSSFSYFKLQNGNNIIIVPCYIMEIEEFRMDEFVKRMRIQKENKIVHFWPLIK